MPVRGGSIPACAGKPCESVQAIAAEGRSPRQRGSPCSVAGRNGAGSIPASAGKPRMGLTDPIGGGVDPRVSGEAANLWSAAVTRGGRSPRQRGSRRARCSRRRGRGSIPASAGKPLDDKALTLFDCQRFDALIQRLQLRLTSNSPSKSTSDSAGSPRVRIACRPARRQSRHVITIAPRETLDANR